MHEHVIRFIVHHLAPERVLAPMKVDHALAGGSGAPFGVVSAVTLPLIQPGT